MKYAVVVSGGEFGNVLVKAGSNDWYVFWCVVSVSK